MSKNKKLTYGCDIASVTKLAWPIMLSMASYTIMDVTDTLMVSWLGTAELAAIGVATTVFFLFKSFFIGLFESVKILVAQQIGSNNKNKALEYGVNGLILALPCSVLILLLGPLSNIIFYVFGGPQEIQEIAVSYFKIRVFSPIFWFMTLALTNFFQGVGDTKTPMRASILVCILNIILDYILIYGFLFIPGMGVEGSALATVISSAVGGLYLISRFLKYNPKISFLNLKNMINLIQIGWPSGVRWMLDIAGFTIFTAMVARLGEVELAANQIGIKILHLSILPCWGIAEATCILTGYFFGAQKPEKIKKAFFSGLKLTLGVMLFLGTVFLFFRAQLIQVFSPSLPVLELSLSIIILVVIFQIFEGLQNTCSMALNGTGETRFPMKASMFTTWCVMLPLSYILGIVFGYGLIGMWAAAGINLVLLAYLVFTRFMQAKYITRMTNYDPATQEYSGREHSVGEEEPLSQSI